VSRVRAGIERQPWGAISAFLLPAFTVYVALTGPDGEVAGTLSVDENVISFVPDPPL